MARTKKPDGPGKSQRQLRVGELIRRTLSDLLMRGDIHNAELNAMSITVGEVRMSTDLKMATAYVLPLGGKNADVALRALRESRHEVRRAVSKVLTLKYAPEVRFAIDETFDRMDETNRLLNSAEVRRDLEK